jgi:hypothetical protein
MVTAMYLARYRLNSQWRIGQKVVRTVHAALGRGLFILLNCHGENSN